MRNKTTKFIATVGGIGLIPFAPGTFGSLAGLLFLFAISFITSHSLQIILEIFLLIIFLPIGIIVSDKYEKIAQKIDPSEVVIDEFIGMIISVFTLQLSIRNLLIAFVLFRFFDIFKPFPINKLQEIKGGWGIMLDDIAAGFFSFIILFLLNRYLF